MTFEICAACRGCCFNIPESICSYNTLLEALNGRIPEATIRKMVIYRVREEDLDRMARRWILHPFVNLLQYITPVENGERRVLALPAVRDNCIFLTEKGCAYPDAKPFECAIYPFYIYKLKLETDYECDYARDLADDEPDRENLSRYMADHLLFCEKNSLSYLRDLKILKNRYALQEIQAL
jgi:Fe-S-cluster containining protein